jgi:SAM-dependent methyltransferase
MNHSAYDDVFFEAMDASALRSAEVVVSLVQESLPIRSVFDVGCGRGGWLRVWQRHGVDDVFGIDGPYLDPQTLLIPREKYQAADLSRPLTLGRQFDLVESLEVGEHIAVEHSNQFLETILSHGKPVLFSAAVPGQGGTYHVNEQPYEHWRDRFAERGYALFDFVRPHIVKNRSVDYFYRYNILLFAHESVCGRLPQRIQSTRIAPSSPIPNMAPRLYRLRCKILQTMSPAAVTRIAQFRLRILAAKDWLLGTSAASP